MELNVCLLNVFLPLSSDRNSSANFWEEDSDVSVLPDSFMLFRILWPLNAACILVAALSTLFSPACVEFAWLWDFFDFTELASSLLSANEDTLASSSCTEIV